MKRIAPRPTLSLCLAVLLTATVIGLGGLSFQRKVDTFQPLGFEVREVAGHFEVVRTTDPASPLLSGDQILLVEGREVGTLAGLRAELRRQASSETLVLRQAELLTLRVPRPPLAVDFPYLILSLIAGLYLTIGVYTLLRDRRSEAFLFFLWCLASAAVYLLSPTGLADAGGRAIYLVEETARLLLAPLTLHLFLAFPVPSTRAWVRRLTPYLYLPAAALLLLQADLAITGGRLVFGRPTVTSLLALDRLELAHLGAFSLLALTVLVSRLARPRRWEAHRQAQWIAVGLAGGYLPFLALYVVPLFAGWTTPQWLASGAVLPLALVPLAFAYAILRYKLWDLAVIVRGAAATTLTLLLGLLAFSLFTFAVGRGVPSELAALRSVLSFAAGVGIASLMVPARRSIAHSLERFQYRSSFGPRRALALAGTELLHERDLDRLAAGLLDQLAAGLDLDIVNLFLRQGEAMVPMRPEPGLPTTLGSDALGEGFWDREVTSISGVAFPGAVAAPAQRLFLLGYRYAFPLVLRGNRIGVVALGYRDEETPLNSEDIDLVRGLLNQAALAVENAQLMNQLQLQVGELARLQQHTEGIIESSPAGLAVLDGAGCVRSANLAFAAIVGRPRPQTLGRPIGELLPVQPLPDPGADIVDVSYCDERGEERHLQISVSRLDRGPFAAERLLMVQDTSERMAMEHALKERERLASLGMLAAGVAHEVNTPITGISSYAQMLLADTPESDPRYELLKKVERQTFRAARIVNSLLEFARDRQTEMRPVAIAALLGECADLLKERLARHHVRLDWQRPADDLLVAGSDGELQQVFTNLMVNAIDAMSTGGRLMLRADQNASRVRIVLRDTGPGIPPQLAERIFQPFFSTKLGQGGTGLGLSISYNIVRRHGGEMRAENHSEGGACFTIELPCLAVESVAATASR
jgi:two-component system, NtrC family, sensor kinase